LQQIKKLLDKELDFRNTSTELSYEKPDPLMVAKRYNDEKIALVCALFGYGKATNIVKFLDKIDFEILNESEEEIKRYFSGFVYRFQNQDDIANFFITLKRVGSLEEIFTNSYKKEFFVLDGVSALIKEFKKLNSYNSKGYSFLISKELNSKNSSSTYKRWNMYLRWMVRKDSLDLGLWRRVDKAHLLIPLDTHTFKVSQKLGLLKRKTYDLKAVFELTNTLKSFDKNDPIKYDFALYRLGQEGIV
jgi:uncharacterized protein (TIGR02757 family)